MNPVPVEIHASIVKIMDAIGAVPKGRKNQQQGYNFRGIADLYTACQPVMAKYGVHVAPHEILDYACQDRPTKSGGTMMHVRMRVIFRAYSQDGSFVQVTTVGEAMDAGDKSSNKAMSAAMKYALIQLFSIPEDDPDIDTENSSPEVGGGNQQCVTRNRPATQAIPAAAQPQRTQAARPAQQAATNEQSGDIEVAEVMSLRTGKNANGKWTLWKIVAKDGRDFTTMKDDEAGAAELHKTSGDLLGLTWTEEQKGKFINRKITSIIPL